MFLEGCHVVAGYVLSIFNLNPNRSLGRRSNQFLVFIAHVRTLRHPLRMPLQTLLQTPQSPIPQNRHPLSAAFPARSTHFLYFVSILFAFLFYFISMIETKWNNFRKKNETTDNQHREPDVNGYRLRNATASSYLRRLPLFIMALYCFLSGSTS